MIVFKCISCGSRLRVSDEKAGKRGKCPKCAMMVRVPRSQDEADASEAHRAEVRARKLGEQRQRREADGDVFSEVVGEVLSDRPVRKSPARHDPQRDGLGVQPPDAPAPDESEAPDPEALRRSAEAPSAPPMSWPVDSALSDATGDSPPGSDLDALAQAMRTAGPGEEGRASASDDAQALPDRAETAQGRPEAPAEHVARTVLSGTAAVKGSHGLLALLVLLAVVAGIVAIVAWRNREHTWRFRDAITRCLPSVKFSSDGAGGRALPGCLTGKILLCNESGGPCSLRALPDPRLVARSADEVGTVIFIRRNDGVPEARTFRVMGRSPVRRPVGYEMCAVDVASGRRICADTVVAADDKQAVEALHRLIERCLRP